MSPHRTLGRRHAGGQDVSGTSAALEGPPPCRGSVRVGAGTFTHVVQVCGQVMVDLREGLRPLRLTLCFLFERTRRRLDTLLHHLFALDQMCVHLRSRRPLSR